MILSAIAAKLKRRSQDYFKGRHYEATLILQAVSWYLRYPLSYRGIEELFRERGLEVMRRRRSRSEPWRGRSRHIRVDPHPLACRLPGDRGRRPISTVKRRPGSVRRGHQRAEADPNFEGRDGVLRKRHDGLADRVKRTLSPGVKRG
jgi:hypothetical protein